MTVYVDADACPVTRIAEQVAKEYAIPVVLLCDTNHVLSSDYSEIRMIGAGADAVDIALINLCQRGDIVVTQDYGVAALARRTGKRIRQRRMSAYLKGYARHESPGSRANGGYSMISTEVYKAIISDLMDELPEAFFRELSGGVIMSEALVIPDYAQGNDLYTLGQYQVCYGLRQIVMFKGSFDRLYPQADEAEAREILRGALRHEFRHHIEFLGGIHDASSLEAEDARKRREYLDRHGE